MKKITFLLILLLSFQLKAQEQQNNPLGRPFFTGVANLSFTFNENYVAFDTDDGEAIFKPTAIFARAGFGYEFKRRLALSVNAGFDYHWNFATSAFPTYGAVKYNITESDDDTFFVEMRYGSMWRPSNRYRDGNYYGFGIGTQVAGEERWNTIFRLDFHRKQILGFENNRIDSISLGIGFSFF